MSVMFNKLTATLLKELDHGGSLKSVKSVIESTSMDVLSIVKIVKTKKLFFLTKEVYHPTQDKLEHLLNSDTVDLGGCNTHSIGAVDLSQQVQGNCGIKVLMPTVGETEVSAEEEITLSATQIKLQSVSVDYDKLSRLLQKSTVKMDHLLILEMNENENIVGLGVVYKVMKNENPMILEKTSKGSACAVIPASKFASVKASAGASSMRRLELNTGCVLGFELHPLHVTRESLRMTQVVYPQGYAISGTPYAMSLPASSSTRSTIHKVLQTSIHDDDDEIRSFGRRSASSRTRSTIHKVLQTNIYDDDDEIRSFGGCSEKIIQAINPKPSAQTSAQHAVRLPDIVGNEAGDWTPIPQVPELHEEIHERYLDFPSLKRGTETELHDFGKMDPGMKKLIWGPLRETLTYPEALYTLNCMLEEGSVSTGGSSLLGMSDDVRLKVDHLLKVMGLDRAESSYPPKLLHPLGLLVGPLSELDQEALTLILDLDGEDRGQVLKMVESVLEQVYSSDGGVPHWSGQFSENAIGMATQVLESCELYLDENGLDPSLGSHGAPAEGLISLYVSLKGLDLLLGP